MAKISLILPVYNGEDTVESCITSIKNQTFNDFECIIINDGSIDDTLNIIKKIIINDKRFKLIDKKHEGLSIARNTGINIASSSIIMYIDADDEALPNMLKHVYWFMTTNELDMVFFDAESINYDSDLHRSKSEQNYFNRLKCYGISTGKDMLKRMIKHGDYTYAVFIQAIKIENIKYNFFPGLRSQDQLYTTQNLFLANKVGHLHETLYKKFCRKKSVSQSKHDIHFLWSKIKTLEELLKFIKYEKLTNEDIDEIIRPILMKNIKQLPSILNGLNYEDFNNIKNLILYN